ncbi:MAG: DUF3394 domain-containing protein, partial [Rhodospirillales bacterium]|nr:DUF3394 domain-containing protein [Rhodospirillales bacterium]
PLIAVHMFVFYFGIMADVTPPVGLASFAAAAVSGGDPIRTGFVAFFYSLRTALLPFLFIFNTDLLLIDVHPLHGVLIFVVATVAMLVFAAATQGFFVVKSRIYESLLLLLVAFTLFRPGFWMDMIVPPYEDLPPTGFSKALAEASVGSELRLRILGVDDIGQPREFVTTLTVPDGASEEERLASAGLELLTKGEDVLIDNVTFDSPAQKANLEFDQKILKVRAPSAQPQKELMFIPALLILAGVVFLQRMRRPLEPAVQSA